MVSGPALVVWEVFLGGVADGVTTLGCVGAGGDDDGVLLGFDGDGCGGYATYGVSSGVETSVDDGEAVVLMVV